MEISKTDLIKALEKVKPGLANKELIEQATSFAFINGKVHTFNDEISISYPVNLEITGAVKAEELYAILNKITSKKEDIVDLEIKDNEIIINGKRTSAGVKLQNEVKLPLDEVDEVSDEWFDIPDNLIDSLKLCKFSASKDMSRPILNCVYADAETNATYASDSYRFAKAKLSSKLEKSFLIPTSVIITIEKYKFNKYQAKDNWIHFKGDDGILFSFRTSSGEYPVGTIEEFLSRSGVVLELPTNMKQILERSAIFAKRDNFLDEEIKIDIVGKLMTITGEGVYGWVKEKASLQTPPEKDVSFSINPEFMKQILQYSNSCMIADVLVIFSSDAFQHAIGLSGN